MLTGSLEAYKGPKLSMHFYLFFMSQWSSASPNYAIVDGAQVEISKQDTVGAWMTKITYYFMKMMIPACWLCFKGRRGWEEGTRALYFVMHTFLNYTCLLNTCSLSSRSCRFQRTIISKTAEGVTNMVSDWRGGMGRRAVQMADGACDLLMLVSIFGKNKFSIIWVYGDVLKSIIWIPN